MAITHGQARHTPTKTTPFRSFATHDDHTRSGLLNYIIRSKYIADGLLLHAHQSSHTTTHENCQGYNSNGVQLSPAPFTSKQHTNKQTNKCSNKICKQTKLQTNKQTNKHIHATFHFTLNTGLHVKSRPTTHARASATKEHHQNNEVDVIRRTHMYVYVFSSH